jgi:hypothetical protein
MKHLGRAGVILGTVLALGGCALYPAPYYGYPGYAGYPGYYAGGYYAPYAYSPAVVIGGGRGWGDYGFHDGRR